MTATAAELAELRRSMGDAAYRRALIAAKWQAHDLRHALHAGQKAALSAIERVHRHAVETGGVKRYVLNIARRWGKTWLFVVFVLMLMLRKPGARIPYAARSETSVREFVEPLLLTIAADAPPHLRPREYLGEWIIPASASPLHRKAAERYAVPVERGTPEWRDHDSRLIVKGCEDRAKADRLRGPAADAFIVDEAGFIPILGYVVKSVATAQLSTTRGMMLVGSSAPETPEHEFWIFADEATTRDAYMHATVYDAPHLSELEIKSFQAEVGGADTVEWQREGLSRRVVDTKRAVYPEWAQARLVEMSKPETIVPWTVDPENDALRLFRPVVGEIARPEHFDTYVVGDLGFSDMTVVLLGYYHFALGLLVIEAEVVTRRQTSDVIQADTSSSYTELYGEQKPVIRALEGDALVVAAIRKEEKIARGEAERGKPDDEDDAAEEEPGRWSQIAFVQMEAAVNAARTRIKRRGVLVHPDCKVTIAHCDGAIWNAKRTAFERVKPTSTTEGHHFDGAAALAYIVKKLQPNRNPFPAIPPGLHPNMGTHIPPAMLEALRQGSDRDAKLRRAFMPKRVRR